jgi:hypothetical protein
MTNDGNAYTILVTGETDSIDLTLTPADELGYVRVNDMVIRETDAYTVDLSNTNFVSLAVEVYAEDHETSQTYTIEIKHEIDITARKDADKTLAYFVDCGDYDVSTLSDGDLFGVLNGVTDQAYGKDPVTGYEWGIVDTVSEPLKNGTATNAAMTNAVYTDNTWPYETDDSIKDGASKTATNRYTKNQYESGIARNLNYEFEVPNGEYEIELYFTDPWNCSKNPIVSAEETVLVEAAAVNQAVSAKVEVTDGKLSLNITAPDETLCLNLAYIKIYLPEGFDLSTLAAVTDTGNGTTDGKVENKKTNSPVIPAAIAVIIVVVAVGAVVVVRKKKK